MPHLFTATPLHRRAAIAACGVLLLAGVVGAMATAQAARAAAVPWVWASGLAIATGAILWLRHRLRGLAVVIAIDDDRLERRDNAGSRAVRWVDVDVVDVRGGIRLTAFSGESIVVPAFVGPVADVSSRIAARLADAHGARAGRQPYRRPLHAARSLQAMQRAGLLTALAVVSAWCPLHFFVAACVMLLVALCAAAVGVYRIDVQPGWIDACSISRRRCMPLDSTRQVQLRGGPAGLTVGIASAAETPLFLGACGAWTLPLYDALRAETQHAPASVPHATGGWRFRPSAIALALASGLAMGVLLAAAAAASGAALHAAAHLHAPRLARAALAAQASVDSHDWDGKTALYIAVRNGDVELVHVLLGYGADPNSTNGPAAVTPLHVAAEYGRADLVRQLLARDADPNALSAAHRTPLWETARRSRDLACADALARAGAKLDLPDGRGWTPLHEAASQGAVEFASWLARHGANLEARTAHGRTPLDLAFDSRHAAVMKALSAAGARIDAPYGRSGWTMLALAAQRGDAGMTATLLDLGADLDAPGNADGLTPLALAAWHGRLEVARVLLRRGADPDGDPGNNGPPLHLAVAQGHAALVALLLESGAHVNAPFKGWTPLRMAEYAHHDDIARTLEAGGAHR